MEQGRVIIRNKAAVSLWPSVSLSCQMPFGFVFFLNTKASPARVKTNKSGGGGWRGGSVCE